MGVKDYTPRRTLGLTSVPSGQNNVTTSTATVTANSYWGFVVTTTPDSQDLSLWNFLWSVAIDTNDSAHLWPAGLSLTSTILTKLYVTSHVDWAESSDSTNVRREYILIQNTDSSSHTLYLYYKAYTQPGVGTTAAS